MASRGKMVGAAVLNNGRNALGGTNVHNPIVNIRNRSNSIVIDGSV